MNNLVGLLIAFVVTLFFVRRYLKQQELQEVRAQEAAKKGSLRSDGPQSQHPHIDAQYCIGCATCTLVCPEGDVLAMLGGQAVIVNGYKCIGHSLCAEVCPVGAITMVMASPSMGADLPQLSPDFETSVPNLFIVGELGGLAAYIKAHERNLRAVTLPQHDLLAGISALCTEVDNMNSD